MKKRILIIFILIIIIISVICARNIFYINEKQAIEKSGISNIDILQLVNIENNTIAFYKKNIGEINDNTFLGSAYLNKNIFGFKFVDNAEISGMKNNYLSIQYVPIIGNQKYIQGVINDSTVDRIKVFDIQNGKVKLAEIVENEKLKFWYCYLPESNIINLEITCYSPDGIKIHSELYKE